MGNTPLKWYKQNTHGGGVRDPLVIHWPERLGRPGGFRRQFCRVIDIVPTVLELAGVKAPKEQDADGVSLVPLLKGGKIADRPLFWHYPHYGNQGGTPGSSVRCGDWKLIEFFEDGRFELYHTGRDIGETKNLADSEPDVTRRLHALMTDWRKRVKAPMPTAKDGGAS